ncbi:chemotaxis protein CheB [Magnetococcales bacterium HHB-1]
MIKLVIVDDDAFTRIFLRNLARLSPEITIVGEAENGKQAIEMVKTLKPDVVTMDVMMPEMDGLETTRQIMKTTPCPIIMVSELTQEDSHATLKALEYGAVDYLSKSSTHLKLDIPHVKEQLVEKITYWATNASVKKKRTTTSHRLTQVSPSGPVDLVVLSASTGGIKTLPEILKPLTNPSCIILIAQTMPAIFTEPFKAQVQSQTDLNVIIAQPGVDLEPGTIYIAPGGKDCILKKSPQNTLQCEIKLLPDTINHPSGKALFSSVAQHAKNAVAIILSGKGKNVVLGAKKIIQRGWPVLVQDPTTCIADRACQIALKEGAATESLSPEEIGQRLAQWL